MNTTEVYFAVAVTLLFGAGIGLLVLWSKNSDVLKRREFLFLLGCVVNSFPQAPAA